MSTARVDVVLERTTRLDQPDDVIRLVGVAGDAFTAESVEVFGPVFEVSTADLFASYGVTSIERGTTEAEAVTAAVERNHNALVASYFSGNRGPRRVEGDES